MVDQTANQGSVGYGQQDPFDSNSDASVLDFIVRQRLALVDTVKPCQVTAVHAGSGTPPGPATVDVQLLVNLLDGSGNSTPQGVVYGVPAWRLQAGPWAIVADPAVGDVGILCCSDRDISSLKSAFANGAKSLQVNPGSYRRLSVSDGFFIGGFLNKVPKATMWLRTDGTLKLTDQPGNVVETSSTNGIAFTPASGFVTINGDVRATGEVTAKYGGSSVTLSGHKHTQGNDSAGDIEVPTNAPTAGT